MFKSKKRGFEGKQPRVKEDAIIKFNIAGSGIPSSATVLNAQMKMYYYGTGGSGWVDRWLQAHQILVNWAEAQATSVNRLTGTAWNVAYVGLNDIDAKSSYESTLFFYLVGGQQVYGWKSWDLTSLTQKWVSGTATNYGVVLWATNETTDGKDLRFYSSEATAPNDVNRPYLEVIYSQQAKTVYFLKDHLGSIRATVQNTVGAPVRGYDDYDPWGYILAGRSLASSILPTTTKNRFTGKERDDEFGVNWDYFGARYYDAQIGRWLARDPLAERYASLSPFVYAINNPMANLDPNGAYSVRAAYLFGYVGAQASRVTFSEAQAVSLAGLTGVGGAMGLVYKHGLNDPSFSNSSSDYAFAIIGGILWGTGKIVEAFSHGDEALGVLEGAFKLTDQTLFAVDQFLFDATPLALDELTFEVADRTNVGGIDLGSVSGGLFTLNTQLAQQFERSEAGAGRAKTFLDNKLQTIQTAIERIAKARGYNLARAADRAALRRYLNDEENQDEINQFMEEAQSQ